MNILLVNSAFPELWGGGEKWFIEAAKWFNAHGHLATIVARPGSHLMMRTLKDHLDSISCKFGGDFDPLAMMRAREIIRASRASVVLTNFNKESWQFGMAANTLKIPVVARHGLALWSKKFHHRYLANKVLDKLIVNAESIREYYLTLGISTDDVFVVNNGVAIVDQQRGELRNRLGLAENDLLLAAGGRLELQKRFDRLLTAVASIRGKTKFKLAIFGTGPYEQSLQIQAEKLGLRDSVVFMGFVPNMANIIGDADLFLLTSEDEGMPNVVLEAMAACVPVLGFNVGAMNDILAGELAEFLIPANDETAFQNKLQSLATDRAALSVRRDIFRARVVDEFSFDNSMNRYLEILKQAVAD